MRTSSGLSRLRRGVQASLLVASGRCSAAGDDRLAAKPADATPARASVERLLFHAGGNPHTPALPDWPQPVRAAVARDQARMFLAAVIDAGEGREWCAARSGLPSHEVDTQRLLDLRAHPGPAARDSAVRDSAARAVGAALAQRFPCSRR